MSDQRTVIDAKTAAGTAAEYLHEMVPQATEFLLEEVEKATENDRDCWLITLSFLHPTSGRGLYAFAVDQRKYKTFAIDAESGEVLSMKIRAI